MKYERAKTSLREQQLILKSALQKLNQRVEGANEILDIAEQHVRKLINVRDRIILRLAVLESREQDLIKRQAAKTPAIADRVRELGEDAWG